MQKFGLLAVAGFAVALSLSACGAQPVPGTEAASPTSTTARSSTPTAATETTETTKSTNADADRSAREAEAEASRSAEEASAEASRSAAQAEAADAYLAEFWEAQKPQWRAAVCHLLSTSPVEAREVLVDLHKNEGAAAEEAAPTFYSDACSKLEAEWAKTATDVSTYSELTQRELAQVTKDPDSHAGERFVAYGHISQFDAATGTEAFRAYIDTVQHSNSYDFEEHIMAQAGEPGLFDDLVEGDIIRMHVQVLGSYSYDTQIGGNTTVPMMRVNIVEQVGFDD